MKILLTLAFVLTLASQPQAATRESSKILLLNGSWRFSIHGHRQGNLQVPSTYVPVGSATLEREFDVSESQADLPAILHFDGIACANSIFLNGQFLGNFGPYSPFQLTVTRFLKPGENLLRVEMNDLDGFPPWTREWIPAFPKYGGIIRDVYLEWRPEVYVQNAKLNYSLLDDYSRADCHLRVWVVNTLAKSVKVSVSAELADPETEGQASSQFEASPGESVHDVSLVVPHVRLWSPESPHLYGLKINLVNGKEIDHFKFETGFREFKAQGRDFFLNGKKYFLKGVFRHDMYGDEGHTLTPSQMESDIADIKSLGANFIRLGHYAHDSRVVELAAKYGLLVSEEPPIFAMSQKDPQVVAAAKFSLKGIIERDWNSPAVVVWFLSNEVGTDLGYMKEMAKFVRSYDESRLVSLVDNTKWTAENAPWQKYRDAKLDFIAQNAYGSGLDGSYEKLASILPEDLPYVISEWGGTSDSYETVLREGQYYLAHSNVVLKQGPRIAGISFWEYADIPIARWSPESTLHWSLTDKYRHPYETYFALKSLYTGQVVPAPRGRLLVAPVQEKLPRLIAGYEKYEGYEAINLSGLVNSDQVLKKLNPVSGLAYPEDLTIGQVVISGLPFRLEPQLILLSRDSSSITIPIRQPVSEIDFLGHVCFNSLAKKPGASWPDLPFLAELGPAEFPAPFKAYPYAGEFDEHIGRYILTYEDGQTETISLSNGVHFADYRRFMSLSIIDPVATDTEQALVYKSDFGTKTYQLRLFTYHPNRARVALRSIQFQLDDPAYVPMLAAVTVRLTGQP